MVIGQLDLLVFVCISGIRKPTTSFAVSKRFSYKNVTVTIMNIKSLKMLNTAFNIYLTISTHHQVIGKKSSNCPTKTQPMQSIQPIQQTPGGPSLSSLTLRLPLCGLSGTESFASSGTSGLEEALPSHCRSGAPHHTAIAYGRWQGKQKRSGVIFFSWGGGGRCLFLFLIFFLGGGGDFNRGLMLASDFAIWLG